MRDVMIRRTAALAIAGIPYRGPYEAIGDAFRRMHEVLTERALYRDGQQNVAVYFSDVAVTPPAECLGMAGRSVVPATPVASPLERFELAAGDYAVLRHRGPYADLGASNAWLMGTWLPASGRAAAEQPCYEIYLNTPMDAEPADLVTDIYLPLK